jgi:hypothetical protein
MPDCLKMLLVIPEAIAITGSFLAVWGFARWARMIMSHKRCRHCVSGWVDWEPTDFLGERNGTCYWRRGRQLVCLSCDKPQ